MTTLQKTCTTCNASFVFTDAEQEILAKVSPLIGGVRYAIPAPDVCGLCRAQRVTTYLNEKNLFQGTCAITGKPILSLYHPDSPYKVIDTDVWWSDRFDAQSYGVQDIDFSRPFFEQFLELKRRVPRMNVSTQELDNSPYVNAAGKLKNCYMVFNTGVCENMLYGKTLWLVRDSIDCFYSTDLEQCYSVLDSSDCYNCAYLQDCTNCKDSQFLFNCKDVSYCIGCVGLRHASYQIFNKPVSKEEYDATLARLQRASYEELQEFHRQMEQRIAVAPRRYIRGKGYEDSTGNYLVDCPTVERCFKMINAENCFDCYEVIDAKDQVSVYEWGETAELMYYSVEVGDASQGFAFCTSSWKNSSNLWYCDYCISCKDCFGCTSLRKKQYCILNKQYTKEEYEELLPKLIAHMQQTGEWGDFFPMQDSHLAYNESVAQEHFPKTKEQCTAEGLLWRDRPESRSGTPTLCSYDHPTEEDAATILATVFTCAKSGRPYKIIPQEYAFYLKHKLPLPRLCFDERLKEMMAKRTGYELYQRPCSQCQKDLTTAYKTEVILCDTCYEKAFA